MVFGGVYLVYSSLFCDMLMCSLTVGCMFLLFSWLCLLLSFCCFFFFQAEDGIRDADVTGVQTCALPISWSRVPSSACRLAEVAVRQADDGTLDHAGERVDHRLDLGRVDVEAARDHEVLAAARSEERRVGKEARGQAEARAGGETEHEQSR